MNLFFYADVMPFGLETAISGRQTTREHEIEPAHFTTLYQNGTELCAIPIQQVV